MQLKSVHDIQHDEDEKAPIIYTPNFEIERMNSVVCDTNFSKIGYCIFHNRGLE